MIGHTNPSDTIKKFAVARFKTKRFLSNPSEAMERFVDAGSKTRRRF